MIRIAVFCGSSSGKSTQIIKQVHVLGHILAERDFQLIYGGSKLGLMGELADAVLDKGGSVTGVIPSFLKKKERVHPRLTDLVVTNNMHDRKVEMYRRSDCFLILPGGFGTMDEFFEIATWGQLGLHSKPIAVLNLEGYYDHLIQQCGKMVEFGFLEKRHFHNLIVATSIDEILSKITAIRTRTNKSSLKIDQL